jgi:hypothetical protein
MVSFSLAAAAANPSSLSQSASFQSDAYGSALMPTIAYWVEHVK